MRASVRQRSGFWLAAMLAALACASSARVAAAQELELPVPRAIIYPGDVLSDDKLEQRAFVARTVARSTIHEARDGLVGKFAKRTLLPGQPIPINAVRDPWLVTQGKTAMVVFEWGGADSPPGMTIWNPFAQDTSYMEPSSASFMVNFRVADLDGLLGALRAEGCNVVDKTESSEQGKFGWVIDPEGNKVELWEPPAGQ